MGTKKREEIKHKSSLSEKWPYPVLFLAVLVTFGGALSCGLTNWDDQYYVSSNPAITSWTAQHLRQLLLGFTAGNYHPLTMLSFSIDYFFYQKNPAGYHFTNLLLHALNTLLVFGVVKKLCGRMEFAFLVALFFGIHPMHAESVVWVSERKDLLYTFFLLLSVLFYLKLPEQQNRYALKTAGIVVLFFVLSLLSKAQAVVLPVLFLLTDYYRGQLQRSRWLEKIPLLLISLVFGIIAIHAQQSTEAMEPGAKLEPVQRVLAAGYGVFTYSWKAILPFGLSCLHPYPEPGSWGWMYYAETAVVLAALIFAFVYREKNRGFFFGISFFIVCLLPVLQLLPVGNAILSERYTYVAYIGLFFAVLSLLPEKGLKTKTAVPVLAFAVVFVFLSWGRCGVWQSSETLWTDVLEQYDSCAIAYCNRGVAYSDEQQTEKAEKDFKEAVRLDSSYTEAYNDLGLIYNNTKRYREALLFFNRAIRTDSLYGEAYNNRGVALINLGLTEKALTDFSHSVRLLPAYANAWSNRGNALVETGDTTAGIHALEKAADLYRTSGDRANYDRVEERLDLFARRD